jgi:hypothetical protein
VVGAEGIERAWKCDRLNRTPNRLRQIASQVTHSEVETIRAVANAHQLDQRLEREGEIAVGGLDDIAAPDRLSHEMLKEPEAGDQRFEPLSHGVLVGSAIKRLGSHQSLAIEENDRCAVPFDLEESGRRRAAALDDAVNHEVVGQPFELPEDLIVAMPRRLREPQRERDRRDGTDRGLTEGDRLLDPIVLDDDEEVDVREVVGATVCVASAKPSGKRPRLGPQGVGECVDQSGARGCRRHGQRHTGERRARWRRTGVRSATTRRLDCMPSTTPGSARRIALVTCRDLPRPDSELAPLAAAIAARGAIATIAAWDDPAVDWAGFDCAVLRSTWNYVRNFTAFTAWLAAVDRVTSLVNPIELIRWNIHKRYLLELAAEGIAVVPTELVEPGVMPAWERCFARWGDLVVKPAISAGSFGTIQVAAGDATAAARHRDSHAERAMLIQPLLHSVLTDGERNLVFIDGAFSHAVWKGARWSGQNEASGGPVTPERDEIELGRAVLAAVSRRGPTPTYARVDIARLNGVSVLMELELIEPSLFLDRVPEAPGRLAEALLRRPIARRTAD